MALIVEDGSLVANANTYLTEAQANAILAEYGKPALGVSTAEASLKSAAKYLEGYRSRFLGNKVDGTQSLQFPRMNLTIDGFPFPADEIPRELKDAQALLANLTDTGTSLYNVSAGQEITQKTVDVISVTYAETGVANAQPSFGIIDATLEALLKPLGLTTVRI